MTGVSYFTLYCISLQYTQIIFSVPCLSLRKMQLRDSLFYDADVQVVIKNIHCKYRHTSKHTSEKQREDNRTKIAGPNSRTLIVLNVKCA